MQTLTLQLVRCVMMQIMYRNKYRLLSYSINTLAHLHTLGTVVQCSAATKLALAHQAPIKILFTLHHSL